ncbi:MAG: DUF4012 domain-containing protein [Patescibacteria group bacterium]|nr:DUF4012 domain-containing protein [Patescibacteria group bacterium]
MRLKTEILPERKKILLVSSKQSSLVNSLRSYLENLGAEIFFSSKTPKSKTNFDYCFHIKNQTIEIEQRSKKNKKTVSLFGNKISSSVIEKIIWFAFSQSQENFLKIYLPKEKNSEKKILSFSFLSIKKIFSLKNSLIIIALLLFIYILIFISSLVLGSYFGYLAFLNLKKNNLKKTEFFLDRQNFLITNVKKLYSLPRPIFLFFSVAIFPDNLIDINEKSYNLITDIIATEKNLKEIFRLFLKKNKNQDEKFLLTLRLATFKKKVNKIENNSRLILQKISGIKKINNFKDFNDQLQLFSQLKPLVYYLDEILAKDSQKKYLLLFANNRELRPGGGFIGSFGIITLKNLTLEEIKIYDVYDADGQLKAHIEPPPAIRKYLNQPHWFLRDSAFSPDFLKNYTQAKNFLEKEMGFSNFDAGFLITTSAIENILEAMGSLYLPDFKEIINQKNFYLKTQLYAEKNFFPGSLQKKNFLSSLMKQVLIALENASFKKLAFSLKRSLDEKQLIIYFDNPTLQKKIDSLYWSGQLINPQCLEETKNCLSDFLFPLDANLGVNKANFFINRLINLKTYFSSSGKINHLLSINFKNESLTDVFPGGVYHNYFQTYLPKNAIIDFVTKNGIVIDSEELEVKETDQFKIIAFFFEVKPKTTVEIKIKYQLSSYLKKGRSLYQLIIQKQTGSDNNDLILDFDFDKNISLINNNFSPLVKNNQILYNTNLSTDKIFLVEINRN